MKKLILPLLSVLVLVSCKQEEQKTEPAAVKQKAAPVVTDTMMDNAVIYEANIRQYSPEGTFEEFTKDIPQLKELGVKVIWLMPIYPISETKRKATGGADSKFASEFPEGERERYLGSYYAVTDFEKINPEFGTMDDFEKLVATAHDNDMYVILDWVPNHTGWDHVWLKENPEYYTQDKDGNVIHPEGTDWTDVADLNYDNQEMRKEMIDDMKFWLTEKGVDGFRCDVAGSVPTDFWQQAIPQLREVKPVFMLAEAWEPELLDGNLFDMAYGWETHHKLNDIAQGKAGPEVLDARMESIKEQYDADDILMNFITNHDENSWNGTVKERMGAAADNMLVTSYMLPGMPLIYSGQEYGMDHRLKFFEKDSIPKTKGATWELLKKLGKLKVENVAMDGGKTPAMYKRLPSDAGVYAVARLQDDKHVVFVSNMTDSPAIHEHTMSHNMVDYMTGDVMSMKAGLVMNLKPWEYKIYVSE